MALVEERNTDALFVLELNHRYSFICTNQCIYLLELMGRNFSYSAGDSNNMYFNSISHICRGTVNATNGTGGKLWTAGHCNCQPQSITRSLPQIPSPPHTHLIFPPHRREERPRMVRRQRREHTGHRRFLCRCSRVDPLYRHHLRPPLVRPI